MEFYTQLFETDIVLEYPKIAIMEYYQPKGWRLRIFQKYIISYIVKLVWPIVCADSWIDSPSMH